MKNLLLAASALIALGVLGSNEAAAQHCRSGHGYGYGGYGSPGLSVSIGYGGYSGYGGGYSNYGSGYSGYGYQSVPVYQGHSQRVWHDTSHLDYHGPSLIRHRGHYDYVPGHYDVHRSGHWDRYGGW